MPGTLHTVQLAHVPPQPWKNGGGATCELLAWPSAEAWDLRLSVATIDRDGPFSAFEGIHRWFSVIEGAGVELQFAQDLHRLKPSDHPMAFDGAQAPVCRLLDGATRDLNLMLRRSAGQGQMRAAQGGAAWSDPARWRGVYVAQAALLVRDGHEPMSLLAHTLAYGTAAGTERWTLQSPLEAQVPSASPLGWWLAFEPHAAHTASAGHPA
jgi:uncharacterized protein